MQSTPPKGELATLSSKETGTPIAQIRKFWAVEAATSSDLKTTVAHAFFALWSYRMGVRPATLAKNNPELLDPDHIRTLHSHLVGKRGSQ